MRKYDRKVLYALVVAYMNGLIGKRPLKKWTDKREIFTNIIRKVILIIASSFLLILINEGAIMDLGEKVIIGQYMIPIYRMYNAVLFIPLIVSIVKIISYLKKVHYVNKCISTYLYEESDVQVLDKVTFKINT